VRDKITVPALSMFMIVSIVSIEGVVKVQSQSETEADMNEAESFLTAMKIETATESDEILQLCHDFVNRTSIMTIDQIGSDYSFGILTKCKNAILNQTQNVNQTS
jgi:ATP-dependent protease Clp ATPase subunit